MPAQARGSWIGPKDSLDGQGDVGAGGFRAIGEVDPARTTPILPRGVAAVDAGPQPASRAEAAEFVLGIPHLVDALTAAGTRTGLAYRNQLPDDVVDQFRTAVVHMRVVSLDHVADALA